MAMESPLIIILISTLIADLIQSGLCLMLINMGNFD